MLHTVHIYLMQSSIYVYYTQQSHIIPGTGPSAQLCGDGGSRTHVQTC